MCTPTEPDARPAAATCVPLHPTGLAVRTAMHTSQSTSEDACATGPTCAPPSHPFAALRFAASAGGADASRLQKTVARGGRVWNGLEKRSKLVKPHERQRTAIHEAGT
eukprot:TRINITY_DN5331_c0_g1_i3.p4 TRINITY_DN5331_c0_g1~~TRINITY_DN5331_c0_g1_i3.p4  ORF type:complete len:108 (-),score=16.35 TRINITY_DN5331_c0_g1_i3:1051-1374(-)